MSDETVTPADDEVQGHVYHKQSVTEEDDVQGHAHKQHVVEDDDVEGHAHKQH